MKLSATKYAELLLALFPEGKVADEDINSFLIFLRKNRQERLLPRIFLALEERWKKEHGIREVSLKLAAPVESEELKTLLSEALDAKELILHQTVDPELLGGGILEMEDKTYDLSIRRQLERLKTALLS